jgi:hypothetical protein
VEKMAFDRCGEPSILAKGKEKKMRANVGRLLCFVGRRGLCIVGSGKLGNELHLEKFRIVQITCRFESKCDSEVWRCLEETSSTFESYW